MSMHLSNLPELGLEIARLRRDQGLSQRELGKLSGLAQSTLARLEPWFHVRALMATDSHFGLFCLERKDNAA